MSFGPVQDRQPTTRGHQSGQNFRYHACLFPRCLARRHMGPTSPPAQAVWSTPRHILLPKRTKGKIPNPHAHHRRHPVQTLAPRRRRSRPPHHRSRQPRHHRQLTPSSLTHGILFLPRHRSSPIDVLNICSTSTPEGGHPRPHLSVVWSPLPPPPKVFCFLPLPSSWSSLCLLLDSWWVHAV
jgi:hypothetical protein